MIELADLRTHIRDGRTPPGLHDLPKHIFHYTRSLLEWQPRRAATLIALPKSRRRVPSNVDWTQIIAIVRFRTPFAVIEELANVLAPAVLEMGIVPTIVPLAEPTLLEMNWQTPIVRAMTTQGFLVFDRDQQR